MSSPATSRLRPAAATAAPILSRPAPTFIWPPEAHNGIEKPGQLQPTRCAAERRKRTEHALEHGDQGGDARTLTSRAPSKRSSPAIPRRGLTECHEGGP